MLDGNIFAAGIVGLAALWALVYGGLLSLYFGCGWVLQAASRRHPARRIQARAPSDRARDVRQSVRSLATIALYVAGGIWAQAQGFGLWLPLELDWATAIGGVALSLVLYDAWFYWLHRLMHTRALFRFHALHHKALAPTAWSNNNDTIVGAFVEQSYFLFVPLLLPFPPLVLVAHKVWDQVTGMIGHAGYEFFASPSARAPWPGVCTTYHDQHHEHFHCNYANTFTLWDRLTGTLHPTYDARVEAFEALSRAERAARQPAR